MQARPICTVWSTNTAITVADDMIDRIMSGGGGIKLAAGFSEFVLDDGCSAGGHEREMLNE